MTIESQPREIRIQPMADVPEKSEARSGWRQWLGIGAVLFLGANIAAEVYMRSSSSDPELEPSPVFQQIDSPADGIVDCSKLTVDECQIQLRFERKNREFLDSAEGQELSQAIQTAGIPEK